MICPVCRKDMVVVEYKGIELDYCTKCHGVWFDPNELQLLLKSLEIEWQKSPLDSLLEMPQPLLQEKKRRCPICRVKMRKVVLTEQPLIIIDACQRGDGLWFDSGELTRLLNQLLPAPQAKVPTQQVIDFLREVFQDTQPITGM